MPKSFYIIDGHAQIFRAYFAPFRDLTSPSGEPTKATYVFTQMLLNLVAQRKPDYLAMVIDHGDETVFRRDIYPEYKANRESPPDDFYPQEQRILQVVRDAGVPVFEKPGFEADDLIATMARQLCVADYEVFLVSKDKDLRQIMTPCVHMYDVQSNEVMDEIKLEAKVGYSPREAVEVQTLMGDNIDNVPGIPGVGEKTAAKLIKQYKTADAVLQHLDELTPKLRENFEKHGSNLKLARQLVTLRTDVEFDFKPENCVFRGFKLDPLREHLRNLGFKGLLEKVGGGAPLPAAEVKPQKKADAFEPSLFGDGSESGLMAPSASTAAGVEYELVNTESKFAAFISQLKRQKRFAFDTETDALGAMRSNLVGMSFSWMHGTGWYVPVKAPSGESCLLVDRVLKDVRPILEDAAIHKVGHNLKYDIEVMRVAGVEVRGVELDSMIAAFLLDSGQNQYGIDGLSLKLLNYKKIATEELIGRGKMQLSMDRVELNRIAQYASEDADIALRLADRFSAELDAIPTLRKLADEIEIPLIDVLVEMEYNGIAVDPSVLKEQSKVLAIRIEALHEKIMLAAGTEFNPDSPKQLAEVLFDRLKLDPVKKTKTGYSTDVEVLEKLADKHAVPKLLLEYRQLVKLKNTYLDNLVHDINARTGRIHASFNQIGAATGRLSCNDPNLQNIPIRTDEGRRIRSAFVPGDPINNVLLTADYSQIELRFLAHFTEEPALMHSFQNDEDIHRAVAAQVFGAKLDEVTREQRDQAKIVNFGIIYGISAVGLARRIDGMNVRDADKLIRAYHERFPGIKRFLEECVMNAQAKGYVETITGRRRPIPEIHSPIVARRNMSERMAINSVVQGSAADLIKIAMVNLHRRLKKAKSACKMLLQVHDELVFETPEMNVEVDAQVVRDEMTAAMTLKVPLRVEVGHARNWQEVK